MNAQFIFMDIHIFETRRFVFVFNCIFDMCAKGFYNVCQPIVQIVQIIFIINFFATHLTIIVGLHRLF